MTVTAVCTVRALLTSQARHARVTVWMGGWAKTATNSDATVTSFVSMAENAGAKDLKAQNTVFLQILDLEFNIFSNVGCLCLPGFHGDDCSDTTPSGCDGVTCAHGTCVAGGTCVCEDGYSVDGSGSCTVATCGDVTCGNGAVCVNEECICAEGSHGDLCDGEYSAAHTYPRLKTHFYKQDVIFRSCVMRRS